MFKHHQIGDIFYFISFNLFFPHIKKKHQYRVKWSKKGNGAATTMIGWQGQQPKHDQQCITQIKALWHWSGHKHQACYHTQQEAEKKIKRKDRSTKRNIPWFKRRLHIGSTCIKGPSFWCSASNSDRYWLLQKQQSPFSFLNQKLPNLFKANQTED